MVNASIFPSCALRLVVLATSLAVFSACDRTDTADSGTQAPGPAQQIGAKVDQAAAKAGQELEQFKERHGPKLEEAKAATEESVRKLTGVVGEQLERVGQKAQDLSDKPKEP